MTTYTTYDNFLQPDYYILVDGVTRLQTGEYWRVYGGAEVQNHRLRFRDLIDDFAEVAVDLTSPDHEVATYIRTLPTDPGGFLFLVARHDSGGGYGVVCLFDYDAQVMTFIFASPDDLYPQPGPSIPSAFGVGDKVALRITSTYDIDGNILTSLATCLINDIEIGSLDLTPYPEMMAATSMRVAIAAGDTSSEYDPFLAATFNRSSGMSNLQLQDVSSVMATYGRGVVFYADKWDGTGALTMAQLGVTEGDIVVTPNATTAKMTLPELTGPAGHEMDYLGEAPTVEIPLYLADPALIAICSPSGSAHAGRSRRGPVKEYTLMVIPEAIFLDADGQGIVTDYTVAFDGAGAWTFNGQPLDTDRQAWLDASFWMWRCVFNRPTRRFRGGAGDDKKNIETVTVESLHHPLLPEGHHIYTTGDPFASGIDLNGLS